MYSTLTVVTNDCHANSTSISHVAEHCEWCQTSLAVRINDVTSAYTAGVSFNYRTGELILTLASTVAKALLALQM